MSEQSWGHLCLFLLFSLHYKPNSPPLHTSSPVFSTIPQEKWWPRHMEVWREVWRVYWAQVVWALVVHTAALGTALTNLHHYSTRHHNRVSVLVALAVIMGCQTVPRPCSVPPMTTVQTAAAYSTRTAAQQAACTIAALPNHQLCRQVENTAVVAAASVPYQVPMTCCQDYREVLCQFAHHKISWRHHLLCCQKRIQMNTGL